MSLVPPGLTIVWVLHELPFQVLTHVDSGIEFL